MRFIGHIFILFNWYFRYTGNSFCAQKRICLVFFHLSLPVAGTADSVHNGQRHWPTAQQLNTGEEVGRHIVRSTGARDLRFERDIGITSYAI